MGIAGSIIISTEFFEEYLGMRVESVDEGNYPSYDRRYL